MEDKQITMLDLLTETHIGLQRQGPGSMETTLKALSFIDNINEISRVADLGCGTGGQTIILAQNITGTVVGVDELADFIGVLNENAKKQNLEKKLTGIVGSMENLSFQKEEFDLIWCEGAIDAIGFETGLAHWNTFLKKNGYVAVTCPSWFNDEHPNEIQKFWINAGSGLDTVAHNIGVMQKCGYSFVASFVLPENCWTNNYFSPRQAAEKSFSDKYPGNKIVEEYVESSNYEMELYSKYKQYYGYVFYIGKKI